jgi:O-antigen biosynthesis protein
LSGTTLHWGISAKKRLRTALRIWRTQGSRAVVGVGLEKARALAGRRRREGFSLGIPPNPVQSRPALLDGRFAACTPLTVYSVPRTPPARVTMVTDSINSGSLYGGVGTAMILAALVAESRRGRLRIVTRTERALPENLDHVLGPNGVRLTREVEFVFAPATGGHEVDVLPDELFLTTSWWTTAATMGAISPASIVYLLQEDERGFYPLGDEYLRCEQVLSNSKVRFVVNSRLLFDHLVQSGLENLRERGTWFEPAFPKETFYPRARRSESKRTMMFYARPNHPRNLFYFGLEVLEAALERGVIDVDRWDIVLLGKDIPTVTFADGYTPARHENLTWAQYADFLGSIDLGLSLMHSPHPSYPPLDLAASGAIAVTNRWGTKTDLAGYSKNILCGDLDRESMLAALAEGVSRAEDDATRSENLTSSNLGRDWSDAFAAVVESLTIDG